MLFGVIVPSTNTSVQPEYDDMRPSGVSNHTSRAIIPDNKVVDEESFMELINNIRGSTEDAIRAITTCSPGHVIMGMSAETFWDGAERANRIQEEFEAIAGVGVTMGSTACEQALAAYGGTNKIRKIACITPYMPIADKQVKLFFEDIGYPVKEVKGLKCGSPRLIAHETPETLMQACRDVDGDDIDAIVQCGTNLAFAHHAPKMEAELGKPVIAINTATYWQALRRCGIKDQMDGFGPLLSDH
jgi:maleate isomerase